MAKDNIEIHQITGRRIDEKDGISVDFVSGDLYFVYRPGLRGN
jgi:hypothetical protein